MGSCRIFTDYQSRAKCSRNCAYHDHKNKLKSRGFLLQFKNVNIIHMNLAPICLFTSSAALKPKKNSTGLSNKNMTGGIKKHPLKRKNVCMCLVCWYNCIDGGLRVFYYVKSLSAYVEHFFCLVFIWNRIFSETTKI